MDPRSGLCPWQGSKVRNSVCSPLTRGGTEQGSPLLWAPNFSGPQLLYRLLTVATGRVKTVSPGWQGSPGHFTLCCVTLSPLESWAWPMDLKGPCPQWVSPATVPSHLPPPGQEQLCLICLSP